MFVDAIEKVGGFTRPLFTISRNYGSEQIDPGAATMFFVNEEGWAVTCKRVAMMVVDAAKIEKKYADFRKQKAGLGHGFNAEEQLRGLEEVFKYTPGTLAQLKVNFVDCVDMIKSVQCKIHPQADLALIKFDGFTKTAYKGHAVFGDEDNEIKQGKFMCRLGFPFPEFTNFVYDAAKDDIGWTREGAKTSPRFPMEGMVTRLIAAKDAGLVGIELSTPGLKGQSGGPLFDTRGIVYGMQSAISPLNLGQCVHMNVIKQFLIKEGVTFYTEKGMIKGIPQAGHGGSSGGFGGGNIGGSGFSGLEGSGGSTLKM